MRCGPLDHTNLPLFSGYYTTINMVVFLVALAVSTARARFRSITARLWRAMVVRRLIVATKVAFVMLVRVMIALPVVVVATAAALLAILELSRHSS